MDYTSALGSSTVIGTTITLRAKLTGKVTSVG